MQSLTDIHHHLLWGLDDGPRTKEETIRMLHKAAQEGVSCLVATPHIQLGVVDFDDTQYQRSLTEAQQYAYAAGLPVTVLPGAEIYYNSMTGLMLQRGAIPRLGKGTYVLVEFHPHVSFEGICRASVHIANAGCGMVLAHAERYRCLRLGSRLARLQQEYHILIQVNASTLMQPRHLLEKQWMKRAMENSWIDLTASDAHDTLYRPCVMGQCFAHLEKEWGLDMAQKLCCRIPAKVLNL